MLDPGGIVVGILSIIALWYVLKHCDDFSDGNVGADE